LAVGSLYIVAHPHDARACGGPVCTPDVPAPENGKALPANVTALAVNRTEHKDATNGTMTLRRADGSVVPTSAIDATILRFCGLEAGQDYSLEYDTGCGATARSTFRVDPPAPWPTSMGKVEITRKSTWLQFADAVCTKSVPGIGIRVSIEPSEEMRPYLPI